MSEFDKNIPIPGTVKQLPTDKDRTAKLRRMKIGDSFCVANHRERHRYISGPASKMKDLMFTSAREGSHYRIWRVL